MNNRPQLNQRYVSGTLTKLDILGNYLADWDCDEDDEGGRAIRIEYAGANGFVSNFIGNQIIARFHWNTSR